MSSDINKPIFDHYWQLLANPILVNPTEKISVELKTLHSPLNWKDVFGNDRLVEIEVGSGKGRFLKESAQKNPEINYVGIERASKYFEKSCERLAKHDITTARLVYCDASYFLYRHVADQSVSAFHIYFPDPWHKKRHHKRRIIQTHFVDHCRTKLKPNGFLHMATDWENYAQYMLNVMKQVVGWRNCSDSDDYIPRPSDRPLTKFEHRGQKLGHGVWDLMFKKQP